MRTFPPIRYLLGLSILLLLTQCQHVSPPPPKAIGFDPVIPSNISYLAGSITFPLRALEDKINRELDPVLVGKGSAKGKKGGLFPFRVIRSGRVRIRYDNQQVKLSTPLQLWITKPFSSDKTPPEKPFCSLQIDFQSPLQVTPNWRLASHIKFTNYTWIVKPEIRLLGKEIPLANLIQRFLENYQPNLESAIDSVIYKELRLDQTVGPVWQSMQKPLLIDRNYGFWLLPQPIAVETSPISGDDKQLTTHLRIALKTQTELQSREPSHTTTPLPQMQRRDSLPQASDMHLTSAISYTDINRVLSQLISQKPPKLAFGMLTVHKASVYGGQQSLIIKTEVSGLLNGVVYLRGRPAFDTLTNTLGVDNLDFDTKTDDAVSFLSSSLVKKQLLKLLSKFLTLPLGDDIAQLPKKIDEAFEKGDAGKKVDLNIQSFRFTPQRIAIRPDGVQALIRVESKVAMQFKKL